MIDPGQAFGTGAHPTTRLCLELLLELEPKGSFVDVGCGSGVLAIVAAKLGFTPVLALDYDPAAIAATNENAAANGVSLEVRAFDLRAEQVPDCDLVAANVLAGPLVAWAASQRELPPVLILSGLLREEVDRVSAAFARQGPCRARSARAGRLGRAAARRLTVQGDNRCRRNLVHTAHAGKRPWAHPVTRRL